MAEVQDLDKAIAKCEALYITATVADEDKQIEIVSDCARLLGVLMDMDDWQRFVRFYVYLHDHATDISRSIILPYIAAKMYDLDQDIASDEDMGAVDEIKGDMDEPE